MYHFTSLPTVRKGSSSSTSLLIPICLFLIAVITMDVKCHRGFDLHLAMLSIFSCACWPFVYLLLKRYSFTFYLLGILLLYKYNTPPWRFNVITGGSLCLLALCVSPYHPCPRRLSFCFLYLWVLFSSVCLFCLLEKQYNICLWLVSCRTIVSRCIHTAANGKISF